MGGPGSGGHNRKSVDEHKRVGTYRRDRHKPPPPPPAEVLPLPTAPPGTSMGDGMVMAVEAEFHLEPHEHVLLVQAGHTLDEVQRMEEIAAQMAMLGLGSAKQPMANPLLNELRQHRLLLASLLKQLRIEDAAGQTHTLASVVNLSRWQKEHRA